MCSELGVSYATAGLCNSGRSCDPGRPCPVTVKLPLVWNYVGLVL